MTCHHQHDLSHACDDLCGLHPAEAWSVKVKPTLGNVPSAESAARGFGPHETGPHRLTDAIADRAAIPILIAHKRDLERRGLPNSWMVKFALDHEFDLLADALLSES
jgi:hypothetical protein